jgi:RNA polymerase sigma factor (sigma-70 family)
MPEPDDIELLRRYADANSEIAFTALVERHVNLVYSTALRSVGNAHVAEEIAQVVFIILARKAEGFSAKTILSGWLYQTTRLAAANFLRTEKRRQKREQEAFMQSISNEAESEVWTQIAPLLDDAMARLGERERDAIVLRFFENKSAREMAAVLRIDSSAAQKRVARAVEKLRKFFTKRSVALSATAIAGAVSANSVQAAPVGLAKTISAVAIAKGSIATAPILTLVKGTMKTITWLKIKFVIGIGIIALLAGGTAKVVLSDNLSNSRSDEMGAATNLRAALIVPVFLKAPTAEIDAIINDFTKGHTSVDPNSDLFKDLLKQHPEVDYLGAPRVITASGIEATVSITKRIQVNGTNANVGITVNVTPTILPDSKIILKFRSEFSQLANTMPPTIAVTKQEGKTPAFSSGGMFFGRTEINNHSQTAGKDSNNEPETLLTFINATLLDQRLEKATVGRAQQ